jgi:hypothetical protein
MTHFVMGIIVPKKIMEMGDNSVRNFIDNTMEPYSESYEVEPHIEKDKEEIEEEYEDFKKRVKEKIKKKEKVEEWETKSLKESLKKWVKIYHGYELDKEGNATSTFNNNSFYDWYVIGGRWSGILKIPENDNEKLLKSIEEQEKEEDESIQGNSVKISLMLDKIKIKQEKIKIMEEGKTQMIESLDSFCAGFGWADILRAFVKHQELTKEENEFYDKVKARVKEYIEKFEFDNPYVLGKVVDPKGNVHEGVRYGWFGMSDNTINPNVWIEQYIKLLEKYKEDYMVSLDCHV